jgi:hypothetical protein
MSKSSKDRCVASFGLGTIESSIDSILPKALHGIAFQVRCCSSVLGVLEAPNAVDTLQALALFCSAVEEVILLFAGIPNYDFRFEEAIHGQAPSFAKSLCEKDSMWEQHGGSTSKQIHTELGAITLLITISSFICLLITYTIANDQTWIHCRIGKL